MAFKIKKSLIEGSAKHKGITFKMQRKDLAPGIAGEANNDGTVFISKSIKKGSPEEAEVGAHEADHMLRMKKGELGYSDNDVTWKGKKYPRKDGYIKYNGKWVEEGNKNFPWEKRAYKAADAALKKIKNGN